MASRPSGPSGQLTQEELERATQAVTQMFTERLQSGQFDDLTIREVRVKAAQEAEALLANDAQASIVSIIVFIVFT
jgi:hypothetical protein